MSENREDEAKRQQEAQRQTESSLEAGRDADVRKAEAGAKRDGTVPTQTEGEVSEKRRAAPADESERNARYRGVVSEQQEGDDAPQNSPDTADEGHVPEQKDGSDEVDGLKSEAADPAVDSEPPSEVESRDQRPADSRDAKESRSNERELGSDVLTPVEAERKEIAREFYRSGSKDGGRNIESELRGIDFSKDVEVVTVKKGDVMARLQAQGTNEGEHPSGRYFYKPGADRDQLGTKGESRDGFRETDYYVAERDVQMLRTTAKDVPSFYFSKDATDPKPRSELLYGGEMQYFTKDPSAFSRVVDAKRGAERASDP